MRLNYAAQASYHAVNGLSATDAGLFNLVADRRVKFRVRCVKIATVSFYPGNDATRERVKFTVKVMALLIGSGFDGA